MDLNFKTIALLETDVDQGTRMLKDGMKKLIDALTLPAMHTKTVLVTEEDGDRRTDSINTVLIPEWAFDMLRAAAAISAARCLIEMKKDGEVLEKKDASSEETLGENLSDE